MAFRDDLLRLDPRSRDAWVDRVLGTGDVGEDGTDLPRGCVPYLPSPVDAILRLVDRAAIGPEDTFVDVGSGLGRATMLVHLLTGALAIGLEVQADLAHEARRRAGVLGLDRVRTLHGDAADLVPRLSAASVFFFYSPFGGERMDRVVASLELLARARPLRLCFLDTPPPGVPWLVSCPAAAGGVDSLSVCRTHPHPEPAAHP